MNKVIMILFLFNNGLFAQEKSTGTAVKESTVPITLSETAITEENVPVYEYKPRVIIEGKWGDGPGEFGTWGDIMNSEMIEYQPNSLSVDSKGNIYILDLVNERIQKFDSNGKYLKSISVESFSGKRYEAETTVMVDKDNPEVSVPPDHPRRIDIKKKFIQVEPDFKTIGINIVIDSKDNLYYYLVRREYDKEGAKTKETGEVWLFKDDKLVEKMKQGEEKIESELKEYTKTDIVPDGRGNLYYYLKEMKDGKETIEAWRFRDNKLERKMKQGEDEIEKELKEFTRKNISDNHKEIEFKTSKNSFKFSFKPSIPLNNSMRFSVSEPEIKGNYIFISAWVITDKYIKKGEVSKKERLDEKIYIFDYNGKLVGIIKSGIPGIFDGEGNAYDMKTTETGVIVTKFVKEVIK
ncbi:MAG: hypothetical protein GX445_02875 [Elusimicrobia bacterium]|nr:hypothetical protein [Elusimicrobiota bacterium]